jgi:hypothetical protein
MRSRRLIVTNSCEDNFVSINLPSSSPIRTALQSNLSQPINSLMDLPILEKNLAFSQKLTELYITITSILFPA